MHEITLADLKEKLGDEKIFIAGNPGRVVNKISSPENADEKSLCVIWEKKSFENLSPDIPIAAPKEFFEESRDGLICENSRALVAKLYEIFSEHKEKLKGIHPSAVISPDAKIFEAYVGPCAVIEGDAVISSGAEIHAGAFVGAGCFVGEGTVIEPKAVLFSNVKTGKNCLIHSGAVIGCDGFGFVREGEKIIKVPQVGGVTLGDNVEIGACTTIDRGAMDNTFIDSGTKIDNHVQVGHNVKIGKACIICSMSGIAGSSVLEDCVTMSVQAGITDHVTIGKGTIIAGRSGVTNDVPAGSIISGFPARPHNEAKRALVLAADLPELFKRLRKLEKKLEAMQKNEN